MGTARAVLLAAGRGTRLGPLTAATPKCLLRVNDCALLDRQLDAFAAAGVDDVTVVAGFMAGAVVRHVAGRCRVLVNERYATSGSVTSLALAASHLRGHAFLLQNGDTLYPPAILRRLVAAPRENACLVDSVRPYRAGEYHVELADGRVVRYSNALPPDRSVGESAQLLRVGAADSAAFLDRVAALAASDRETGYPNQAYDVLMAGRGLWPVFTAGIPWWEIDTADDLARCDAEARCPSAADPRGRGPVWPKMKRAASLVCSPRLPSHVAWVLSAIGPLYRQPARVARELDALRARRQTIEALDLAVNGARFLRLVLAEARDLGFEPFLLWGTLLGCVRDGGFIKGDRDIDLGVMTADAARLPAFRRRMERYGFGLRVEYDHKLSLVHQSHRRLFIDLDIVSPHRDGWAVTHREWIPPRAFRYHFPAGVFAGTRPAAFAPDLTVRVPLDAEGFLAAAYGDWRTPAHKVDHRYGPLNTELELLTDAAPTPRAVPAPAPRSAAAPPVVRIPPPSHAPAACSSLRTG